MFLNMDLITNIMIFVMRNSTEQKVISTMFPSDPHRINLHVIM